MGKLVAWDYETSGLTPYAEGFQIVSVAFMWRNANGVFEYEFVKGHEQSLDAVERYVNDGAELLVYNVGFEQAVTQYFRPELVKRWKIKADVMRLVQQYGSTGDYGAQRVQFQGFGLKAAATRILGEPGWTDEIYRWIVKTFKCKQSEAAQYLGQAPDDMLREYNLKDCEYTIRLYEFITEYFKSIKFEWNNDHSVWYECVNRLTDAYLKGIPFDVAGAKQYIEDINSEVAGIDQAFTARYRREIQQVREQLLIKEQARFKKKIVTELPPFNINSKAHLKRLFIDILKLEPKFYTQPKQKKDGTSSKGGNPSFKSSHISSYGEPGKMLANRGKRLIILKQVEGALNNAKHDGRYHPQLKLAGTVTFRYAGSSGSNLQGLSRSDKGLMQLFRAGLGRKLIEIDGLSAEPTIVSALSLDAVLMFQAFTGVGKEPKYDNNGLLWIADTYIAYMSVSGFGSDELRTAFNYQKFEGMSFTEAWVKNPEIIKADPTIKKWRKINKMLSLACGYGLQYKKLITQVKEQFAIEVTEEKAKAAVKAYWDMYPSIKKFADSCSYAIKQRGYLVNNCGQRLTPEARAAFNACIQSTVSGIINWKIALMFERLPQGVELFSVIHDAVLLSAPEELLEDVQTASVYSDKIINDILKWQIEWRTGFNVGDDLYECK
jgi:hypothetical protein